MCMTESATLLKAHTEAVAPKQSAWRHNVWPKGVVKRTKLNWTSLTASWRYAASMSWAHVVQSPACWIHCLASEEYASIVWWSLICDRCPPGHYTSHIKTSATAVSHLYQSARHSQESSLCWLGLRQIFHHSQQPQNPGSKGSHHCHHGWIVQKLANFLLTWSMKDKSFLTTTKKNRHSQIIRVGDLWIINGKFLGLIFVSKNE